MMMSKEGWFSLSVCVCGPSKAPSCFIQTQWKWGGGDRRWRCVREGRLERGAGPRRRYTSVYIYVCGERERETWGDISSRSGGEPRRVVGNLYNCTRGVWVRGRSRRRVCSYTPYIGQVYPIRTRRVLSRAPCTPKRAHTAIELHCRESLCCGDHARAGVQYTHTYSISEEAVVVGHSVKRELLIVVGCCWSTNIYFFVVLYI